MVTEVKRVIDGEECVFWSFQMKMTEYNQTSTFWMCTLQEDDHLYVQFHRSASVAEYALRHFMIHAGSLSMPWTIFERAARAILNGGEGTTRRMPSKGAFAHLGASIRYTTTCGETYYISPDELEGLLA